MEKYNYFEAVEDSVRNYIKENNVDFSEYDDIDEAYQDLYDKMFTDDSVTGNASGSFTFSTYTAEEYICHNLDLLAEAIEDFGGDTDVLKDGAEACDVTIRCYVLGQILNNVIDSIVSHESNDDNQ